MELYKDKRGEWFNDYKSYRKSMKVYWRIMQHYKLSPLTSVIPPITPEEYAMWFPFHMIMRERFNIIFDEKND